jgi:hypothetical protein
MVPSNNSILIAFGVGLLLFWLRRQISWRKRFDGLPRVGIDPGFLGFHTRAAKAEFFANGQQLLEQSYAKVRSLHFLADSFVNELNRDRHFLFITDL